ncbi:MAG: hypothetical protein JO066_11485 [Verrucomicrobia bacterium]|nr:hypothetical protein [Verrucomicrobiota bacterium]
MARYDPSWIFYFNNNPLIAGPGQPVIEHALSQATRVLELAGKDGLPEKAACRHSIPGNVEEPHCIVGTFSLFQKFRRSFGNGHPTQILGFGDDLYAKHLVSH